VLVHFDKTRMTRIFFIILNFYEWQKSLHDIFYDNLNIMQEEDSSSTLASFLVQMIQAQFTEQGMRQNVNRNLNFNLKNIFIN
jgi:hypothetical protein